jgi:Tfp pilus assembly protein PilN
MLKLDSALGVEIRGSDLAFATVSKGLHDLTLSHYRVLENYKELSSSEIYRWVQRYGETNPFNRENVILGLPREQVVIRQVELPLEVEENLAQVTSLQVERFEPLEEQESYYDYTVLDRNEEERKITLQIIMVSKSYLEEQLTLFRELNIYPAAVRVSSLGLHQVFSVHQDGYPKKDPSLVIEINPEKIDFLALMGANRFFSTTAFVSEQDLTFERVVEELGGFLSQLNLPGERISKLYFSGALGSHLIEEFRHRFQDCELISDRLNLRMTGSSNSPPQSVVEAIGLAISGMSKSPLCRFNLIPAEKRMIAERPSLVPTLLLAGLLVIMGFAVMTRGYFQQQRLLDQVEAQIQLLQPRAEEAMVLRQRVDEQQAQLDQLQDLMTGRQKVLLVLSELTERIPEDSFLQSLNIQGERVSLTGFSDSASTLLKILLNVEYLSTVESRYITPDRTKKDREKFSFEARIKEQ